MDTESKEERKAIRANRIKKREEALKRNQEVLEDPEQRWDLEKFPEDEVSPVEQQVAESAALLEHLLADTEERVFNVLVASDAREVNRRFKEEEKRNEILGKLEAEANLAKEKFNTIATTWNPILQLNDPLDIRDEIDEQKKRCADLITQKEAITEMLKNELHQADEIYYKDLNKQMNDIKQLGERIDSQVTLMKEAYESQLAMIENSIQIERSIVIKDNESKWKSLYEERDKTEADNLETKIVEVVKFEKTMDDLTSQYREKYREAKLKLETDIQTLQIELQKIKQTCLINSEKIDYNYQILKKRDEENAFVRSQQKVKMNSMQDVIADLKCKIEIKKAEHAQNESVFNKEMTKISNAVLDLSHKAESMKNINDKKYKDVWQMNESRAVDLFQQVLELDKYIHENTLGIKWIDPSKTNLEETKSSTKIRNSDHKTKHRKTLEAEDYSLVRHVIGMIANCSEFLVEKSLEPVLENYEETSQTLWKIDNIFNVIYKRCAEILEIKNESDIKILCEYFTKYTVCTECETSSGISHAASGMTCPENHILKIYPSKVHQALKEFVEHHSKQDTTHEMNQKKATSAKNVFPMDGKDVQLHWNGFKSPLPVGHEKTWDLLLDGLNKYFPILQERIKLYEEVVQLRKENKELQMLLKG